jgi:Zn-dependent protease
MLNILDPSKINPAVLISHLFVLVVAFTLHEFAHAWTATRYGDPTPSMNGRLTLNPLAHLDPIGSLMLLVAGFGWAKPVPINPYILTRRSAAAVMWVSLAGPASNLLMAVIAAIPFQLGLVSITEAFIPNSSILPTLPQFLYIFIYTNLILCLFNLIPLAPLDGEKILSYFLPPPISTFMDSIRPIGPFILLGLVLVGSFMGLNLLGSILGPPLNALLRLLVG